MAGAGRRRAPHAAYHSPGFSSIRPSPPYSKRIPFWNGPPRDSAQTLDSLYTAMTSHDELAWGVVVWMQG